MPFAHGIDVKKLFKINGTTMSASAAELNLLDTAVAGTVVASKALVAGASREIATLGALTADGAQSTAVAVTGTALGTVRAIHGQVTASTTAIASGNVVGVRGLATLSGTITAGGAFVYGLQGKL